MSMLRKYFEEAERRYNYRIKSVIDIDEKALDAIERVILKYNPFDMTQVSKTIHHRNPLDFPNVTSAEVYSLDISLGLPVSPYALSKDLAKAMGCHETEVVVRGENDPTEVESQRLVTGEDLSKEEGETASLLDTAKDYPEHSEQDGATMYGNKYNGKLLQTLKKIADERKVITQKSHDYTDVENDVKTDEGPQPDLGEIDIATTSKHGNFDNNTVIYSRVYKNGKVIKKDGVAVKRDN